MKTIFTFRKTAGFVLALSLLVGSTSCLDEYFISGNHSPATEMRRARNFDEVSVSGSFDVQIIPGDEYSVRITAESNLLDYIETEVIDHKLRIYNRNLYNIHNHEPMLIEIVCPSLNELHLSGSGNVNTELFVSDEFDVSVSGSGTIYAQVDALELDANISGSGKIELEGTSRNAEIDISGSGKIHAFDFPLEYCDAHISGSGSMYVNASKTLEAAISGSGNIYYINHPVVHARTSGSGKVIDRN